MSLVRIKNITQGKLVFPAVREAGDLPLTLEAGEEKDVYPSVATQPSLRAVTGTKVIIVASQEIPVALKPVQPAPAAPPVVIMEEPKLVVIPEPALEAPPPEETAASSNVFKPRKGRR